jgi:hypothetical protein
MFSSRWKPLGARARTKPMTRTLLVTTASWYQPGGVTKL